MAKVLTDDKGVTHLRGYGETVLCSAEGADVYAVTDGELTCPECAESALAAIELTTKAERREWRKL